MTDKYHPVTREELEQIAGRCFQPELHDINEYTCDQCKYESIRGVGCNQKITELKDSVLSRPDPLALLKSCVSNKKDKLHPTCTWKGKRYAYNEVLRLIQQLRENPEAARQQGIKEGWWKE